MGQVRAALCSRTQQRQSACGAFAVRGTRRGRRRGAVQTRQSLGFCGARGTYWSIPFVFKRSSGGGAASRMQQNVRTCSVQGEVQLLPAVIADNVQLEEQTLDIGGRRITLVAPTQIDAVVEMYIRKGQNDRDPYWARPWPSGVAMADFLLSYPQHVSKRLVCDLGAGLGISGIAASMAGAEQVWLLDREPRALQCAMLGAQATGLDVRDGTILGWDGSSGSSLLDSSGANTNDSSPPSGGGTNESPPQSNSPPAAGTALLAEEAEGGQEGSSPEEMAAAAQAGGGGGPFADLAGQQQQQLALLKGAEARGRGPQRRRMFLDEADETMEVGSGGGGGAGPSSSLAPLQLAEQGVSQVTSLMAATSLASGPSAVGLGGPGLPVGGAAGATWLGRSATAAPASHPIQPLPPAADPEEAEEAVQAVVALVFDWLQPDIPCTFDVILASDVLYESGNVEPVVALLPRLLRRGGHLLLADPPNRTPRNREAFLQLLQVHMPGLRLLSSQLHSCQLGEVEQEMIAGGTSGDVIPVQIFVLQWQA